jgi:ATP-dependent exoDNAse (exonuclease V) alpha subunit
MTHHLSIRVPWHDNNWNGSICNKPERNQSCRVLKNIAKGKDDLAERDCAGYIVASDSEFKPPCITESGMFMSDHEVCVTRSHPYKYDEHFNHIQDTDVRIPAYSFVGTPYKWTLKDGSDDSPNDRYFTQFKPDLEIDVGSGNWISNGINQKHIFDYFYRNIILNRSLVVAYAKAVPFIESLGRIITGIGLISSIGELQEYNYSEPPDGTNKMKSFLWERKIGHTIRTDRNNGFLFPFEEIQAYLKDHPDQNPEDLIVIAPDEYINEFSYATEHISSDALILTLNSIIQVLRKYKEIKLSYGKGQSWDDCISWCEKQLKTVWEDRGMYPGLGAVLSAFGIPYGFDVANVLRSTYKDTGLWDNLIDGLKNIHTIVPIEMKGIRVKITGTIIDDFDCEINTRKEYLKLLSRISLTTEQAALLLDGTLRTSDKLKYADQLTNIHKKDYSTDIVDNPYILYEKTYMLEQRYQIGIGKIDIAMFPPEYVLDQIPESDKKNQPQDPDDKRRLRAIILYILEREAKHGSSLMLINNVVEAVCKFRSDVQEIETSIRLVTIKRLKDEFKDVFIQFEVSTISEDNVESTETALKLKRIERIDDIIRQFINGHLEKSNEIDDNWEDHLKKALRLENPSDGEREKAARDEKIKAIRKMAQAKVSVLTGGAGTGKTTTLVALCMNETIQRGRILVLAPTGKARVVLSTKLNEQDIEHKAQTLFQYLKETNHCDAHTWSYYLSRKKDSKVPDTIIIDECSMLTEEMFGALAEAVSSAKRVIFVGDPNQLPPIGTGKPFYELVQKFREEEGQLHYATLLVTNRQKKNDSSNQRLDVELSKLFTEDWAAHVSDDIFERIEKDCENVEFTKCEDISTLPQIIYNILEKEKNIRDIESFDFSLGGFVNDEWINFRDAKAVEDWQILTPYRNNEISGSSTLNRQIQLKYRTKDYHKGEYKHRSTKHPLGTDAIAYGEKVINVKNQEKQDDYVANGEIGLVCGIYDKNNSHIVIFSSQNEKKYYYKSVITESDSALELAYALTTHKAQGSGFKMTIFVLVEPERGIDPFVVRELLYTAFTRQSEKICIIYNKQPSELKKYANPEYSDLAHRKTNLFIEPVFKELKSGWYDSKLIHITLAGERVRSKSEVIVANALFREKITYAYERLLEFHNGEKVLPDFTITKPNGETIYWEHLGMLGDYGYRKDWEHKKQIYAENGITIENGLLKTSQDELSGAINSQKIQSIIETITI